jgi:hypothetical protein
VASDLTGSHSIYLMASSTHVDAIRDLSIVNNIKGYQGHKRWCETCWVGYEKEGEHHCRSVCRQCKSDECDTLDGSHARDEEDELRGVFMCMGCRRTGFKTEKCLELHALKCGEQEWCRTCGYEVVKDKEHKCWHARCPLCKTRHDSRAKDRCFIQKASFKEAKKHQKYICGDIETRPGIRTQLQDLVAGWDGSAGAKPLELDAVMEQVCDHVTAVVVDGDLQSVNEDATFVATGLNCLIEFFQWLEGQGDCTILCHNGAGFDFHFMHEVLMARYCSNDAGKAAKEISVIDNAGRYLRMSFGRWTFLDSYSFIPEALSKFSEMFGIEEMAKGFFPHFYEPEDGTERLSYEGPLPHYDHFMPDLMSSERRAEFFKWYAEERKQYEHEGWVLREHLERYCLSDCMVLAEGVIRYRNIFMNEIVAPALMGEHSVYKDRIDVSQRAGGAGRRSLRVHDAVQLHPGTVQGAVHARVHHRHHPEACRGLIARVRAVAVGHRGEQDQEAAGAGVQGAGGWGLRGWLRCRDQDDLPVSRVLVSRVQAVQGVPDALELCGDAAGAHQVDDEPLPRSGLYGGGEMGLRVEGGG